MPDAQLPKSEPQELDVVLCRGTIVGNYREVAGTYDVEFVRENGVGDVRSVPVECVLAEPTDEQDGTVCETCGHVTVEPVVEPNEGFAFCGHCAVEMIGAERDLLRKTLAFYAEASNWTARNPPGSGAPCWHDHGQRALAALDETTASSTEAHDG